MGTKIADDPGKLFRVVYKGRMCRAVDDFQMRSRQFFIKPLRGRQGHELIHVAMNEQGRHVELFYLWAQINIAQPGETAQQSFPLRAGGGGHGLCQLSGRASGQTVTAVEQDVEALQGTDRIFAGGLGKG